MYSHESYTSCKVLYVSCIFQDVRYIHRNLVMSNFILKLLLPDIENYYVSCPYISNADSGTCAVNVKPYISIKCYKIHHTVVLFLLPYD